MEELQVWLVREDVAVSVKMRQDLLELFDKSELKKYMTEEELAGLPASAAAESKEGH